MWPRSPPPTPRPRPARSRRTVGRAATDRASRVEAITHAAHGVDAHGVTDLLAHLRDVHVDGADVAEPVVAPHAVEDLLPAEREPAAFRKELDEIELLRRERHRFAVHTHLAPRPVDR